MTPFSPLAIQHPHRTDHITLRNPWGFLLHTTGSGVLRRARADGKSPIDVALQVYRASQGVTGHPGSNGYAWGGPGYLIGHHGEIHQLAPDDVMTMHAGGPDRSSYLSGAWRARVSAETSTRWAAQWPGVASPQHLYPSESANADYVGAEMIPCGMGYGEPLRAGLRFSAAQHDAAIALGRDLAARHGWPAGWARTPRLLGHEDVQPIERQDGQGGWDPGWLRGRPYFDFELVRAGLSAG